MEDGSPLCRFGVCQGGYGKRREDVVCLRTTSFSTSIHNEDVVSMWDTPQWKAIAKEFDLQELTYNQKDLGGKASKRTTFSTNMDLELAGNYMKCQSQGEVGNSKELSRWSPGTMSMVAKGLVSALGRTPKIKALSWQEHVQFGHVPYRRDCAVCQQTLQQCLPHRRVKWPTPGVLSLDTAGPLKKGKDVDSSTSKYFLCGALVWAVPAGTEKMKQPDEVEDEEAPMIEVEGRADPEEAEEVRGEEKPKKGRPRKEGERDEFPDAPS